MSIGLAGKVEPKRSLRWVWPLNLTQYDQTPTLRGDERTAIQEMFEGSRRREFAREPWRSKLSRLLTPIIDSLKLTGATRETLGGVVSVLLNQMLCRNSSYWSWRENDWEGSFGSRPGPIRASTEFVVMPGLIYWHSRCCFVESMTRGHVANLIGFCSLREFLERQVLRHRPVA